MNPPTDIVIPIRLTREFEHADECFTRCISALVENTHNYRLIMVDDNSDAPGKARIEDAAMTFPSCILIRTHKQRWFTRAVNLGLRLTNTSRVVVLNSDTIPGPGWLEELYAVEEACNQLDPLKKVGLVGGVYSPDDPRRFILTHEPQYVTGHAWLLNMSAVHLAATSNGRSLILDEADPLMIHIRSDVKLSYELNRLRWLTVISHHSKVEHPAAGQSWGHQLHRIPNSVDVVNDTYTL